MCLVSDTSYQPRHLPTASKCGCFRSPDLEFQNAPGGSCVFGDNLRSPRVSLPTQTQGEGAEIPPPHEGVS